MFTSALNAPSELGDWRLAVRGDTYSTFPEAYLAGLQDLLSIGKSVPSVTDPLSVASGFGSADRPALELLGYRLEIMQPGPSLFFSPVHRLRMPYAIGLFLWVAAGSDSVEWLSYYNNRAADFSEDKEHLCGAFGKRLLDYHPGINQLEIIIDRLRADPPSRRAVGMILTPSDNARPDLDYPCAMGVQYFLRDGLLETVVFMRAQQALTILPYDYFVFSGLQALLAARLHARVGRYIHLAGTYHFYEDERDHAKEITSAPAPKCVPFGPMPASDTPLAELNALEAALRSAALDADLVQLDHLAGVQFAAGTFSENARAVLTAHAYAKAGADPWRFIERCDLPPLMRSLFQAEWKQA